MAKLGDLVVRIGADTRDLNKSLGKVQRNMRSMTSNFTRLGLQMTKAITVPILGVGAMAIKSAADLEKMEVSFISLTGGAKQAADMMKQLNEFTAKTPFQIEAVATSARQLIASGTDISKVNEQLQFLGDIAATTGQPINEIAAIFAKVNAKGKVELENLNQLAERGIPIFKALSDSTGLLPSELGAGAVTVKQFNAVLKSFNDEGGIANGAMDKLSQTASGKFSTALDNLKLAGAALAEDLLPIIKSMLDSVVNLAQKFTALSDTTKQNILVVGALVAAIGPLLVILPQIAASFSIMSGPIGLAVIGVTALIGTITALVNANKNIPSTLEKANQAVRGHSTEVRFLVGQYKDETKTLEDRKKILGRLAEIDQTHFGNLSAENTKYKDLVKNLDDYTSSLRASFLEKALSEEGSELMSDLVKAEEKIIDKRINLQKGYDEEWNQGEVSARENALRNAKKGRDIALKALEDFEIKKLDLLKKYASKTDTGTGGPGGAGGLIKTKDTEEIKIFNSEIERHLFLLNQLPGPIHSAAESITTLSNGVQDFAVNSSTSLLAFLDDFKVVGEEINEIANTTSQAFDNLGDRISNAFVDAIFEAQNFGDAMVAIGKQILKTLLSEAIANAISNASSFMNAANQASGGLTIPGFIAAAVGSVKAAFSNIPALAEGGLAYGPTLAMVGDNRGANVDPEVVAPLSKLKNIIGGGSTNLYGRISGDDIVISNSRAARDRNRYV